MQKKTFSVIDNDNTSCFLCGRRGAMHRHHALHGSRRKKAEEYGLTVYLCPICHQELHDHGKNDLELERLAQEKFEEVYGHEKWMKEFHKNYL